MFVRKLAVLVLACVAVTAYTDRAEAQKYTDHLVQGFNKQVLRTFDPDKRQRLDKDVRREHIKQTPIDGREGVIIELRSVDDLVCVRTTPAEPRDEVCVLAATLSPCLCNYAADKLAEKESDIGGLSGVVTPNGGTCMCE